ncbi:hypothetical protein [Cryptosporangium minutisporangium]|uniref:Glycerophosphoryl diester phosphodiesterase membrane domain-containing protein n=1 Tax=Cryptosporangium minutisporangium TaxID=113569 RepID=A0ABP6T4Q3_9ACTN
MSTATAPAPPVGLPPLTAGPGSGPVPLRPMSIGEVLDGGMDLLRRHPGPTLGVSAVLVGLMLLIVVPLWWLMTSLISRESDSPGTDILLFLLTVTVFSVLISLASTVFAVLASAVCAVVLIQETAGAPTSLAVCWARLRPTLGRLLLLALALTGINAVIAAIPIIGYFVPLFGGLMRLSVHVLIFEGGSIGNALRRATQVGTGTFLALVRQLWIRLLAAAVSALVWVMMAAPLMFIAVVLGGAVATEEALAAGDHGALLLITVLVAVAWYLPLIVVWAFRAGIDTVLYLDGRMRSEALDVEWGLASRLARKARVR